MTIIHAAHDQVLKGCERIKVSGCGTIKGFSLKTLVILQLKDKLKKNADAEQSRVVVNISLIKVKVYRTAMTDLFYNVN